MNATRFGEFRIGPPSDLSGPQPDQQMDQIRELLFGEMKREMDARLARMETRIGALEARLDAMAGEIENDRRSAFDVLARGITDLGDQIKRIGKA